jgi:hypothetical protein
MSWTGFSWTPTYEQLSLEWNKLYEAMHETVEALETLSKGQVEGSVEAFASEAWEKARKALHPELSPKELE